MSIRPLSFRNLQPTSLQARQISASEEDFATLCPANSSFAGFIGSLPGTGAARRLIMARDAMANALRQKRGIIVACGGRVISTGLGPLLIRAMEQRRISALALTGDALLQDVEVALSGHTVLRQPGRDAGAFGVSEEAGELINHAIHMGARENIGIGEATASALLDADAEYCQYSLVASAGRLGMPVTVHPAIGMDAFAIHPKSHGESLGATGMRDFQILAALLGRSNPGVVINVASSMLLPRVLVQALDVARQLARAPEQLTAIMIAQRGDRQVADEILERLTVDGGTGLLLPEAEELLLPLLFAALQDVLGTDT